MVAQEWHSRLPHTHQVIAVGAAVPLIATIGYWGLKNWEANDYLILRSKVRD